MQLSNLFWFFFSPAVAFRFLGLCFVCEGLFRFQVNFKSSAKYSLVRFTLSNSRTVLLSFFPVFFPLLQVFVRC